MHKKGLVCCCLNPAWHFAGLSRRSLHSIAKCCDWGKKGDFTYTCLCLQHNRSTASFQPAGMDMQRSTFLECQLSYFRLKHANRIVFTLLFHPTHLNPDSHIDINHILLGTTSSRNYIQQERHPSNPILHPNTWKPNPGNFLRAQSRSIF